MKGTGGIADEAMAGRARLSVHPVDGSRVCGLIALTYPEPHAEGEAASCALLVTPVLLSPI